MSPPPERGAGGLRCPREAYASVRRGGPGRRRRRGSDGSRSRRQNRRCLGPHPVLKHAEFVLDVDLWGTVQELPQSVEFLHFVKLGESKESRGVHNHSLNSEPHPHHDIRREALSRYILEVSQDPDGSWKGQIFDSPRCEPRLGPVVAVEPPSTGPPEPGSHGF